MLRSYGLDLVRSRFGPVPDWEGVFKLRSSASVDSLQSVYTYAYIYIYICICMYIDISIYEYVCVYI